AGRRRARVDKHAQDPWHDLRGAERCARVDTHNADTSLRFVASHRAPVRRSRHAPSGASKSSGAVRSARKLDAGNAHVPSPKPPGPFGPASSPFSAVDLFQRLNGQLALSDHPLQLRILSLKLAQSLHVRRLQCPKPAFPNIDRLFADFVFPGNLSNRAFIRLAQNGDHLFFGKPDFLHQLLASSAGAIVSSYDWSEKPGQVTSSTNGSTLNIGGAVPARAAIAATVTAAKTIADIAKAPRNRNDRKFRFGKMSRLIVYKLPPRNDAA